MRTRTKKKDARERDDLIVDFIKESGPDGVAPSDIATLFDLNIKNRARIMHYLIQGNPQIVREGSGNKIRYIWKEDPIVIEKPKETHSAFLKNRYEKTNKNDEGYTDMTATQAIRNVEPDKKPPVVDTSELVCPNPGEVWLTKESNGSVGYVYILAYSIPDAKAPCIRLFDIASYSNPGNVTHDVRVKLGSVTLLGDLMSPTSKSRKYLTKRIGVRLDEQLMKVRKELAGIYDIEAFRIKTEKVVEEKIVYKELEVPEGCISEKDAEILRLKQLVDVYSGIAWGLMARPQGVSIT